MPRKRSHDPLQWKKLAAHVQAFRPEVRPLFFQNTKKGTPRDEDHHVRIRILSQLFLQDVAFIGRRRACEIVIEKKPASTAEADYREARVMDAVQVLGTARAEDLLMRFANATFYDLVQ